MSTHTILVTGGAGYIGSRLIRDLGDAAYGTVRVLDNLSRGSHHALVDLPGGARYEFVEGDILDPDSLRVALRGVSAVVHLAGLARSPYWFEQPARYQEVNHWGTRHLVDACRHAGVERFLYVSSAAVYGTGGPYVETDACRPVGPYAESKLQAEACARQAGAATILRLATVCGWAPAVRFDAAPNRYAFLWGAGRALPVYGSGEQRRPVIDVADASAAILFCLAHPAETTGQAFNAVAANPTVVELARLFGPDPGRIRFTEQETQQRLSLEVSGARLAALGWTPRVDVAEGLRHLAARFTLAPAQVQAIPD